MVLQNRLTFLLGAGASFEAGVPMSMGLTKAITEHITQMPRSRHHGDTGHALNLAVGALIAHGTARGKGAYDGIDVEQLFSAVQMLAMRDDLEISPFVSAWASGLDELDRKPARLPGFFRQTFAKRLAGDSDMQFENLFKSAVRSAMGRSSDTFDVFALLQDEMIAALRECLAITPGASAYLNPLHEAGPTPIRIATLNYDTTIEQMASEAPALGVDTGIQNWEGGFAWQWSEEADFRLLKLHGSINWVRPSLGGEYRPFGPPSKFVVDGSEEASDPHGRNLGVVFGQRVKLRADGPFLAMLLEFAKFLEDTDHLIVIGYSFRDDHINEIVKQWLLASEERRVTLVDPALANTGHMLWDGVSPFLEQLLHFIGNRDGGGWSPSGPHAVLRIGASDALLMLAANGW